jgi:hypothetical protein
MPRFQVRVVIPGEPAAEMISVDVDALDTARARDRAGTRTTSRPSRASAAFTARPSSTQYSKVAFVKLYDRKNALVAADMLNDRVLPFFEEKGVPLLRILTDRGTEYCGNREHHEYQLYLAVENIDHPRTKAYSPQTNGICERFHRTMQEEFYSVAFRKRLYSTLEDLQADVDAWLEEYNERRPHSGKYCFGKTATQTFLDAKHLFDKKQLDRISVKTRHRTDFLRALRARLWHSPVSDQV